MRRIFSVVFSVVSAMTQDLNKGISNIKYNILNLPQQIDIKSPVAKAREEYYYSATGEKIAAIHHWNPNYSTTPVIGSAINTANLRNMTKVQYHQNLEYDEYSALLKVKFDNGYYSHTDSKTYVFIKDHLGNIRSVADLNGNEVQRNDYDPFGMTMPISSNQNFQQQKFSGKELSPHGGLNFYDFHARTYDPARGQFLTPDPLAEKYPWMSPYTYCMNNPIRFIDPLGMDTVHVLDQGTRPLDNGTAGQTYTADIYVIQNGTINGPYSGSSYPNSKSNTDNTTSFNTVNEGEHQYNNSSGHKGGTKKGLNLVDSNGNRNSPGTDPDGNSVTMSYVNVHAGASDNGNYSSRGSQGCITINPSDVDSFFGNFDWSGSGGKTGTSTGSIIIERGGNVESTKTMLQGKQHWQQNPMTPLPIPTIKPLIITR